MGILKSGGQFGLLFQNQSHHQVMVHLHRVLVQIQGHLPLVITENSVIHSTNPIKMKLFHSISWIISIDNKVIVLNFKTQEQMFSTIYPTSTRA